MMWVFLSLFSYCVFSNVVAEFENIHKKTQDPVNNLKKLGSLVYLGNSDLKNAQIVFLPEIHDDADSLLAQMLILAHERKKRSNFILLDESLKANKKSPWEFFTQKAMEVVAAKNQGKNEKYSPSSFEAKLNVISKDLQKYKGILENLEGENIWSFNRFSSMALPFYGWDKENRNSLTKRNEQMVKTLKGFEGYDKIYVMLGARHVPDLEYATSKDIVCKKNKINSIDNYFLYIKNSLGKSPEFTMGIGSTLPVFEYVKNKKYSVVFVDNFFKELKEVMRKFHKESQGTRCVHL